MRHVGETGGVGRAGPGQLAPSRKPRKGHVGRGCSVGVWVGGLRTAVAGASFLPHRRPGLWAEVGVFWGVTRRFSRRRGRQLHIGCCSLGDERPPSVLTME